MSASRDQSQRFTFVYSNLYSLYKKGVQTAKESKTALDQESSQSLEGVVSGKIIKARDLNSFEEQNHQIKKHIEKELKGEFLVKRLEVNPSRESLHPSAREAMQGLKSNVQSLESLHEKLKFMLKEIEENTAKKKSS
jgi:hypothetical protein